MSASVAPPRVVCLTDVTDPTAVEQHSCVRTLADDQGNRYVLLTTAQYLRLLRPDATPEPEAKGARASVAASDRIE
jgi:hypothetical protein